ncbi:MAG: hypothetical protein J6B87_01080 [Clostridia bacterium]|nr:hypothetical protein [Clostridia bacterium]
MKRLIITFLFLAVSICIFYIAPNYQVNTFYDKDEIRIVINDKEVTKDIPDTVKIVDEKIMLSKDTIDIYFDKWLYYDEKYETYITTSDIHIAKMKINSNTIEIDGVEKKIDVPVQLIDNKVYIPIEELEQVYNIEIENNSKIIITTPRSESVTITAQDEIILRGLKKRLSRKITKVDAGEMLDVYRYSKDKDWVWVRTSKGELGYVRQKDLAKYNIEEYVAKEEKIEKINLVWEYAESYTPDRTSQDKIKGIDVISPTWIYLKDTEGNLRNTVDKQYISWAHKNGYKIWAVLKNDRMGIENTSKIVTNMKARENLIIQLLSLCEQYNLDGINIDFEEMKKEDSKEFSQFVREISSSLRKNGYTVSVDVTVPDGSDTWSLCYDRYELAEAVDYLVLMAYDQYGASSKKAGSVASLSWVENNLKKMIERDGVNNEKIILGIPLYSRLWKVKDGNVSTTSVVTMKYLDKYLNSPKTSWIEEDGQYYYENVDGNTWNVMWMDEKESIVKKLSLIEKYDLAGSAFWMWGYENENFWNDIKEYLNY